MTDTPNRWNMHASDPVQAEGLPPEEEVSQAKIDDQLDDDPEQVPNFTDPEGGPQEPPTS
jgi:hypothetical protein